MTKRIIITAAALAFIGIAAGAGTKVRSLSAVGAGAHENPDCDGMAMLTFNSQNSRTDVQVVVSGFVPNTVYGVKVESDGGGFSDPLAIQTNNAGNGNYTISVPQNRTGHPRVTIYIWDGDADSLAIDEVSDAEIRAVGAAA